MVCRRSDFEGQPVGEAQNPLGQTFTTQTEGNRVQGGGRKTRRAQVEIPNAREEELTGSWNYRFLRFDFILSPECIQGSALAASITGRTIPQAELGSEKGIFRRITHTIITRSNHEIGIYRLRTLCEVWADSFNYGETFCCAS